MVTGDPGQFFLKSLLTVSFPSENYFQNFGENQNNKKIFINRAASRGAQFIKYLLFSPQGVLSGKS